MVDEGTLDGVLVGEEGEVVGQLVVCGEDGAMSAAVKLGSTGTTKNLQHVQDAQIHHRPMFTVVDICALQEKQRERDDAQRTYS